jgi:hypothetical protein
MEAFKSVAGTQWHFLDTETRESWCGIPPGSLNLTESLPWDEMPDQYRCTPKPRLDSFGVDFMIQVTQQGVPHVEVALIALSLTGFPKP